MSENKTEDELRLKEEVSNRQYVGYGFLVARIIAVLMLLWALTSPSYGYYTLLRFVVSGVTAYASYFSVKFRKIGWAWIYGIIAVLFNPLVPFHLDRTTWALVDVSVAVFLVISIFVLGKSKSWKGQH